MMRLEEVPQDNHLFGEFRELVYARDESGVLKSVKSAGWEVKSFANSQYWDELLHQIKATMQAVSERKIAPLGFYMILNQMDVPMLSQYAGVSRWSIRKHLKPKHFDKLNVATLKRYASVFKITAEQLANYDIKPDLAERAANWAKKYQQESKHGI